MKTGWPRLGFPSIRGELRALGTTALCATHDQETALALSGRVAIMRAGRIVEAGKPLDLYLRPRHPFTARLHARPSLA